MLIANATLPDGRERDVRIADGQIDAVEPSLSGEPDIDAAGKRLFPGALDVHVHFRQPGYSHKETWETGSKSAAAGGVTTVVDQPNTDPATVDGAGFDEKADLAAASYVDYGINGGVTADWDPEELFDRPLFALGEVFLADSTGDMGIDADLFADAVARCATSNRNAKRSDDAAARAAEHDVTITVHAEDADLFDSSVEGVDAGGAGRDADADLWSAFRAAEAEEAAVERAVEVGTGQGTAVHIAHTSTPEGIDAASAGGATCEVTPHHLFLSREDADELGTYGRMNPPLRSEERREAVFERVRDGTVDMIATDHAPHTREEKDVGLWDAPSGVPGVETMLPLLLEEARQGTLSYERVRDLIAANPADVFDLPNKGRIEEGRDADLVLFDPEDAREIRGEDLHSKCEWTPFEGRQGVFPELTLVRGEVVYRDGEFGDAVGRNVRER
ncbi:dihydroorotase [Natronoarchaeum philippinense]|uniref:Dihydroorotase n=1 Tax=Natronoarchaeum philippinense TaxID=558529 RepID=A0A285NSV7_NATPI|nr:dihydroorotase [Natronoarchaeum philippinense]SNZ12047.1 dihydroorotase [Natronoarchaeum philippinense]